MIPEVFLFFIAGDSSNAFKLTLLEPYQLMLKVILYSKGYSERNPLYLSPTPEQWNQFRKRLDEMEIWTVKGHGHEGLFWEFLVVYGDKEVDIVSFKNGSQELLRGLLEAVQELLSGMLSEKLNK